MRLALGTVQFGLRYGAFNEAGQVAPGEVSRILSKAQSEGIVTLDTAHAYGSAEDALGVALGGRGSFRLVTKTAVNSPDVAAGFRESLARLRRASVYGLLVHHAQELLGPSGDSLWAMLEKLRAEGLVEKIGVSVYTGAEIDSLLVRFPLELVQLPINVFDQRLVEGGQLKRLKAKGVEIHARSAFLQGMLISPLSQLPNQLGAARAPLENYFARLKETGIAPLTAALHFLRLIPQIDEVVVGVLSATQLGEITRAFAEAVPAMSYGQFALHDEKILNPANWGKS